MEDHQKYIRCKEYLVIMLFIQNHPYPKYEEGVFMNFNSNQCDFLEEISNFVHLIIIIEKKVPINCEDIQYIQEELTDSDYEDDDDGDDKEKMMGNDITQL